MLAWKAPPRPSVWCPPTDGQPLEPCRAPAAHRRADAPRPGRRGLRLAAVRVRGPRGHAAPLRECSPGRRLLGRACGALRPMANPSNPAARRPLIAGLMLLALGVAAYAWLLFASEGHGVTLRRFANARLEGASSAERVVPSDRWPTPRTLPRAGRSSPG